MASLTVSERSTTRTIYGREYAVQAGSYVELDGGGIGERLLPGDEPGPCWDGCNARWPNPVADWRESRATACNVFLTGRTLQRRRGACYIRCIVEWVGDGEPSAYCRGWMLADSALEGGAV